jgi:hypothetical protein
VIDEELERYLSSMAPPTSPDARSKMLEGMHQQLQRRAATIRCEHQLVAGEVIDCSP